MSSGEVIDVEVAKKQFDASLDLLKILNGYSAKLTELVKAICRSLKPYRGYKNYFGFLVIFMNMK
jgi:hypothetical protein